jgi:hypothetical protein
MIPKGVIVVILVSTLLIMPFVSEVHASSTLADSLETWLGAVSNYGNDILSTHYGIIFGKLNVTSYDTLAQKLQSAGNWQQIIYLKRVCEISNYTSMALQIALLQALENIPMLGTIPQSYTYQGKPVFLVYHRFLIHAYRYAIDFNLTSKWDKQKAFEQFAKLVDESGGGFLMCTENSTIGANLIWGNVDQSKTRYYDEQAECLEIFSLLRDLGVVGAQEYADRLWQHLNNDGWFDERGWYWYRPKWKAWECEMGGFAMIISRYLDYVPPQVLGDVDWKLLRNGWNSGCWIDNVIVHAYDPINGHFDNPQKRPLETNTVWHALHSLFSEMTSDMKGNMISMLVGDSSVSPAWMLSMNSGCFNDDDVRKLNGAMVMFLTGIVPVTGSLDLGFIEEGGSVNIASYSSADLSFDYAEYRIRIPVKRGEITFLFGTDPVTWDFTYDGTFDVCFSNDWNEITNATLVVNRTKVYRTPDINGDGVVDMFDAVAFSNAFSSKVGEVGWNENADLDYDLQIDLHDAITLAGHFGEHY